MQEIRCNCTQTENPKCPVYADGHASGVAGEYGQPKPHVATVSRRCWYSGHIAGFRQRCIDIGEDAAKAQMDETCNAMARILFRR